MSWQDYKGISGYNRMIDELRESVYQEFPETKGRVYIYNQLKPDEVQRAAQYLNVPDIVKQVNAHLAGKDPPVKFPDHSGELIALKDKHGKDVFLALGGNPRYEPRMIKGQEQWIPNGTDSEVEKKLTPEFILTLAWHNVHEAGHGIQSVTGSLGNNGIKPALSSRFVESHVEVFSRALLVHNGAPQSEMTRVMAAYDARKLGFKDSGPDNYDPSQALFSMLPHGQPVAAELQGYRLRDMAKVYNTSQSYVRGVLGTEADQDHRIIQERALQEAVTSLKSQGKSEHEILAWVTERRDTLLQAEQIISGHQHLGDPVGTYKGFTPPTLTLEQAGIRAWAHYQRTQDPIDKKLTSALLGGLVKSKGCVFEGDNEGTVPPSWSCAKPNEPLLSYISTFMKAGTSPAEDQLVPTLLTPAKPITDGKTR